MSTDKPAHRLRLARSLLMHDDARGVVLYVAGVWPMLAVLWLLQTVALCSPVAEAHFRHEVLLGVHGALSGLMLWLGAVAWRAWRRRRDARNRPRLVQLALLPSLIGMAALSVGYGLTDSPMAMVLMVQIVFARAVFSWTRIRLAVGLAMAVATVFGLVLPLEGGMLPPMLNAPIYAGEAMTPWWAWWTRIVFFMAMLPYVAIMFFHAGVYADRRKALETLVRTDGLTGLLNRREFMDRLAREGHRQARSGRPLTVVMFDVDHFKLVNDRHGHPAGDEVLTEFGRILRDSIREHVDTAARYGGEEFVLLLPETDVAGGERVATKVCNRLRQHVFLPGAASFRVTASAGVAQVVEGQGERALRVADDNLYHAKHRGRDCVVASLAYPEPVPCRTG